MSSAPGPPSPALLSLHSQLALVRPTARIRARNAAATDARVQLISEVLQGCLAMKMLNWESHLTARLKELR